MRPIYGPHNVESVWRSSSFLDPGGRLFSASCITERLSQDWTGPRLRGCIHTSLTRSTFQGDGHIDVGVRDNRCTFHTKKKTPKKKNCSFIIFATNFLDFKTVFFFFKLTLFDNSWLNSNGIKKWFLSQLTTIFSKTRSHKGGTVWSVTPPLYILNRSLFRHCEDKLLRVVLFATVPDRIHLTQVICAADTQSVKAKLIVVLL